MLEPVGVDGGACIGHPLLPIEAHTGSHVCGFSASLNGGKQNFESALSSLAAGQIETDGGCWIGRSQYRTNRC